MTSSGARVVSDELGAFDLNALKSIRNLAELHVREALREAESLNKRIVAAASPFEFIDPAWIERFGFLMEDLWMDGLVYVDDLFRLRYGVPLAPTTIVQSSIAESIATAVNAYQDLVQALVSKHAYPTIKEPVYGEFMTGNAVQYGDVRGLLVKLGGGSADPEVELFGGVTTGSTMKEYLAESDINTDQKIWLYGWEEQPRRTFNGHLQMDGLVFEDWDDDGLIIAPQDRWLRRNYYAPGDHWGCACVVAPYFPNLGEPFEI